MNSLSSFKGQYTACEILKNIVKRHTDAPRSIILYGPAGCGKTEIAKSFAYAMNCCSEVRGDVCSVCSNCMTPDKEAGFIDYTDSLGEFIFQKTVCADPADRKKVIILDNVDQQGDLVRLLNGYYDKFFFVFLTNDINEIDQRVRSRSIDIQLKKPGLKEICMFLKRESDSRSMSIDNSVLYSIGIRADGNFNTALTLLKSYTLMNIEEFKLLLTGPDEVYLNMMTVESKDLNYYDVLIKSQLRHPLPLLRESFFRVVSNLVALKVGVEFSSPYMERYNKVVEKFEKSIFGIAKFSGTDFVVNGFSNPYSFNTIMLSFREMLIQQNSPRATVNSLEKFRKKV